MQPIGYWLRNFKTRLSNFIYFRKRNVFNVLHNLFPSLHNWVWLREGVLDCGCCGYEGMYCANCDSRIIIGYAGFPNESGDFVEYGV